MALTGHGYPYPVGTDRVMDGDDAIHALATAVDTQAGVLASGKATVPITVQGTTASVAVTFPAGRFNGVPFVATSPVGNAPQQFTQSIASVTATGFTINGNRSIGTAVFDVNWIAHLI
jgi:hypothetical protein